MGAVGGSGAVGVGADGGAEGDGPRRDWLSLDDDFRPMAIPGPSPINTPAIRKTMDARARTLGLSYQFFAIWGLVGVVTTGEICSSSSFVMDTSSSVGEDS